MSGFSDDVKAVMEELSAAFRAFEKAVMGCVSDAGDVVEPIAEAALAAGEVAVKQAAQQVATAVAQDATKSVSDVVAGVAAKVVVTAAKAVL